MDNNLKSKIALMIMVFLVLEFLESGKKENHPIENKFSHDTLSRIYLTGSVPITASPTTDLESIKTIQNFMNKK